jgi:hypothetical protein
MSFDEKKNLAKSIVATAPTPPASGPALGLTAGTGSIFGAGPFNALAWPPGVEATLANAEIVRVGEVVGDTMNDLTRGRGGTTAKEIEVGWQFAMVETVETWEQVQAAIEAETTRAEAEEATLAGEIATVGGEAVKLTGNQIIEGTKTFASSPVVPTPAAKDNSGKAADTSFVQAAVGEETTARKAAVIAAEAAAVLEADAAEANAIIAATSKANAAQAAAEAASDKAGAAATAQAAAEAVSIPLAQKNAASGVMGLTAGSIGAQLPAHHVSTHAPGGSDELTTADLPVSVVSGSQLYVSILNHGAVAGAGNEAATTAAIKAAQTEAESLPGNYGVFFPAGEWYFDETLICGVPWVGVPRATKLIQSAVAFTYTEGGSWAIKNKGFEVKASGKHTLAIDGIDMTFTNLTGSEKQGLGIANCVSGHVTDCELSATGSGMMTPLDVFACAANVAFKKFKSRNKTGAAHGAAAWVRNRCTEPLLFSEAVTNITFDKDCLLATNAGDEAISVFASGGWIRDVVIEGTIEKIAGGYEQNHLTSTILLTNSGEKTHCRVENIDWRCHFIDPEVTDIVNIVGLTADAGVAGTLLQNVKHDRCTWTVKATRSNAKVFVYTPNEHAGLRAGVTVLEPYINAEGSADNFAVGIEGAEQVTSPTILGNITTPLSGIVEEYEPRNTAVINMNTEYGCTPGAEATKAINEAIEAVVKSGYTRVTLYFSVPGHYLYNGAVIAGTEFEGYKPSGQTIFPARTVAEGQLTIEIKGCTPPSKPLLAFSEEKKSTVPGVVLVSNATEGNIFDCQPSFLSNGAPFTNLRVIFTDITIQAPSNPQCGGIKCLASKTFEQRGSLRIEGPGATDTTYNGTVTLTGSGRALTLPALGNGGNILINNVMIHGFPTALGVSEHATITEAHLGLCNRGIEGLGPGHMTLLGNVNIEEVITPLYAAETESGALLYGSLTIESVNTSGIYQGGNLIEDVGSTFYGKVFLKYIGASGNGTTGYQVLNAEHLDVVNLYANPGSGWQACYPYDNFSRSTAIAGNAGAAYPTFHPWHVNTTGSLKVTGGKMTNPAEVEALSMMRVWTIGNGSRVHFWTIKTGATAAKINCGPVLAHTASGGHYIWVRFREKKLQIMYGTTEVATAANATAVSTTYEVRVDLYCNAAGGPVLVKVYLGGKLEVEWAVPETERLALTPPVGQLYFEDGFKNNSDTQSEATSMRIVPLLVTSQGAAEHGRSAEMVAGKITIAAPAVTATGAIIVTTEGGTAIGASVVERTPGTGFKVEATATSTDRINWQVYE